MSGGGGWTASEDDTLKTMWTDGASAGQIERQLSGRSRSAVLGRVHRLGLAQRAPVRVTRERVKRGDPLLKAPRVPRPVADNAEDPGPADPPINTLDVRDHHCKWPYGNGAGADYHYCGQTPVPGHPWCDYHCDKAYQPNSKKSVA